MATPGPTDLSAVHLCERPIFILGSPRSGTSILAWSLQNHSRLWTSGESELLFDLTTGIDLQREYERLAGVSHGWFRREDVRPEEFLQALGLGIHALFSSRSKGKRWVDQTPSNTLLAETLAAMFPDALFLHMLRDGRQVVQSMMHFHRLLEADREGSDPEFIPDWTNSFAAACRTWSLHAETAGRFAEHHPNRCLTVVHGELTIDPEAQFARILAFLDVPYEEGPAAFLRSNRINSSFSSDLEMVRTVPWDGWPLEQKRVFVRNAGETLVRLGLVTDDEMRGLEDEAGADRDDERRSSRLLADAIRRAVRVAVPDGTIVLVVSKGDEDLVRLDGAEGWHFPRTGDGLYAGFHPASSEEAIGRLELARGAGAQFLVVPHTSFWWFEHYSDLAVYLRQRYDLAFQDGTLVLFDLRGDAARPDTTFPSESKQPAFPVRERLS
jgi:hypothetical protein